MPDQYAKKLKELVVADVKMKLADAEKTLLQALGIAESEKPSDWPPGDKINQKVGSIK